MSVAQTLRERINQQGTVSVAEFMECCNRYYYATRDPFGTQGDFTTAPEISQIFGELIGAWIAESWLQLGSPSAVLCEAGPGRGTLMKDILRATRNVPNFHASIRVRMIETSPVLQALQKKNLQDAHNDIAWQENMDCLPSLPLLLVANELFDALPVHQFYEDGSERMICCGEKSFFWHTEGKVARETSPASLGFMRQITQRITRHQGAALIIDYGYETGSGDTLQAVRQHRFADVLAKPGESDLTAHVDFGALMGEAANLHTYFTTQGEFLRKLGAELRATALCKNATTQQRNLILEGLTRLVSPEQMGQLFKVLAVSSLVEKPAGF